MGVQFYDPDGSIAAAAMAGPRAFTPKPKTTATQPANAYEWGLRRAAQVPSAPVAQQKQDSGGIGGMLGRGLGVVLNNPIARTITRPLDVLDVPRRAVWSTFKELSDIPSGQASFQDWYDQTNPLHVITQHGDTSFGAGDVLPEIDTPFGANVDKWLNRAKGLAGDIVADPLTYVDGIGFVADVGSISSRLGRLSHIEEGVRALEESGHLTDQILEGAKKVAQSGNWGEADPLLREAAGVSEAAGVRFRAPFTHAVSPALPGTEYLGGKLADVVGAVKGGINASDWGARRIAANAPAEFATSLPVMLAGKASSESFRKALETVPVTQDRKIASNRIKALGSKDIRQTVRQVKEYLKTGGTVDDLIRNTENLGAADTPLNVLATRIREHAADLGVDLPEIADIGYFPHVLSKEFKDMLQAGGEDVERFKAQTDIINNELLGDGGFLQGRKLRGSPERPLTITLNDGRSVTLTQGTVEEINSKMAELFPKLEGTALETDPRTALERYIDSVADDIGNRYAENEALKRGSNFFGDLESERGLASGVGGPEGPGLLEGPSIAPGGPQTVAKGVNPYADSKFFDPVRNEELSKLANEQEANALALQAARERTQAQTLRTTAAGDISNTARDVQRGLEEGVQAVDQRLGEELAPVNARLADINTSRADLAIADQQGAERLGSLNDEIGDLTARQREETLGIRQNEREIRKINMDVQTKVADLKSQLRGVNAKIASFKSRANRLGRKEGAAWRAGREADVANARSELARFQEEANSLRTWSTESQDRLNYQIADKTLSDFNNEIKATQAELERITNVTNEVNRLGAGRPSDEAIAAARRYMDTNPNVARYDADKAIVDAAKAGETVDPAELARARKYLRTKAAKNVPENRAILDKAAEAEQAAAKRTAQDPEVRAAQRAAANADLKTKRTPAFGQQVGGKVNPATGKVEGAIEVNEEELRRLFPERNITAENMREVPYTEYLQRLRRSYGAENNIARGEKLRNAVRMQKEQIDIANKGLADLFIGAGEGVADAARQAEFMWKSFPEQMKRQQIQEQIISIPAAAQVQMEVFDTTVQNLRVDYKTTLFNKERRQAERTAIETGQEVRGRARTDLGSQEAALEAQAASLTGEAGKETEFLGQIQGASGKRSMDPYADIQRGKTLAPKPSALKGFDLATDPATLQPMNQVLNDIKTMASFDPNMTDDVMGATESLLMQHRQALRDVTGADLTVQQTEQLLREANSGRLIDVVSGQLRDTWTMLPGRGNVVVDTELNRMLTNMLKVRAEPGAFGKTLTAFTNFFKTYATMTPGFHVRNAMSAVFMNTVDGVPLRTQMEGLSLWRQFEKAEDPAMWLRAQPKEIRDAFDATFASGAGGRFLESGVAESTASARTRFKESIYRNRATTASQHVGEHVEGSVRLGMALDTVRHGGSTGSAYDRIARIHFDYASVSQMDEKAKQLIPFWTYTSRNLPMQISEMWKKPKVYAWYNSFVRNFSVDPAEFTPEYFASAGAWNTGETVAGMPLYLQPDLPQQRVQEDLDRFTKALQGENIGQVLSDFNPFFTAPIEYASGTDLYTGRQYKPDDYTKAEGFADMAMLPLMKLLGQTKEGPNGTYIQDKAMNAARALNPILDRSVRLIPGSSGSSGDPARQYEAIARTLGIPVRTLSPQQQQSTQRSQYYDQLDQQAMQRVLAGG